MKAYFVCLSLVLMVNFATAFPVPGVDTVVAGFRGATDEEYTTEQPRTCRDAEEEYTTELPRTRRDAEEEYTTELPRTRRDAE